MQIADRSSLCTQPVVELYNLGHIMSQTENKSQREIEGEEANLFCKVASTIREVQDLIVEH